MSGRCLSLVPVSGKTVTAVHWPIQLRPKWYFRFYAAVCTDCLKHLTFPGPAASPLLLAVSTALWAAGRLILKSSFLIKGLFPSAEHKLSAAVTADQNSVNKGTH